MCRLSKLLLGGKVKARRKTAPSPSGKGAIAVLRQATGGRSCDALRFGHHRLIYAS
jgi:hypothetical protein